MLSDPNNSDKNKLKILDGVIYTINIPIPTHKTI